MVVVDPLLPPPGSPPPPPPPPPPPWTAASSGSKQPVSIQDQARDYIQRKRRLAKSESESSVQSEPSSSTYNAIHVLRNKMFDYQNLHGGKESVKSPNIGTFYNKDDLRMDTCTVRSIFQTKQNMSFSFDPTSFECHLCNENHVVAGGEAGRQVFVLTDQCFPPPPMLACRVTTTVFR
jgi:hypothetical protein